VSLQGFRVDLTHHALLDAAGDKVELRPQALDLLCLLASHAGQVMEKRDLIHQVWHGLVVTDDSLVQAIGDIRRAIDDPSHQMIQTVPRRGYRLIEHIAATPTSAESDLVPSGPDSQFADSVGAQEPAPEAVSGTTAMPASRVERRRAEVTPKPPPKPPPPHLAQWRVWFLAAFFLGVLAYLGWYLQATQSPPRLSVVVLPFVNASGDASKEYIADSITEDITVQLSRIKGSFVIGRGTAFAYKGKSVDLKTLAKELNVRYILQGTAGRSEKSYRITAQLIDGRSGANLWADSLEAALDHPYDVREWVAAQLSNALKLQLIHAEASQSARRIHPDSIDLDMQAYSKFRKCRTAEACEASYKLFATAIQLDPSNDMAYAHRILNAAELILTYTPAQPPQVMKQLGLDAAYLEGLSVLDSTGHRALALARYLEGRNEEALQQINESLNIDPNDADSLSVKTLYLIFNGMASSAISVGMKAIDVSPQDPDRYILYFYLCHAHMHLGKFQDAIAWCNKSYSLNMGDYWALSDLVAAYTATGDFEKAAIAKDKLLKLNPEFTMGFYQGLTMSSNPVWKKEIEDNIWAHLRKAGIPE
jgi:TolB-like protein/DNA-binding winged helix-turn-helix (wHTH) protein